MTRAPLGRKVSTAAKPVAAFFTGLVYHVGMLTSRGKFELFSSFCDYATGRAGKRHIYWISFAANKASVYFYAVTANVGIPTTVTPAAGSTVTFFAPVALAVPSGNISIKA